MADPGDPHSPDDAPAETPSAQTPAQTTPAQTTPAQTTPAQTTPVQPLRPTWATPIRGEAATPEPDPHAHDDLIGFTSPASLAGAARRRPEPAPAPLLADPESAGSRPVPTSLAAGLVDADPDLLADLPPRVAPRAQEPLRAKTVIPDRIGAARNAQAAPPDAGRPPAWAIETPSGGASTSGGHFGRAERAGDRRHPDAQRHPDARPEGAMSLYTVYALILFAVPTLGVSALLGLAAVHGRARPTQGLALSHSTFQSRTLWTAAIAAVVGVVMIAVNLGVFVLFFVAVWVLTRGAFGLLRLAAARPIADPRGWWL